jgi:signal transduction histidine kinase/CheY-like chemotaxis protein
MSNKSKNRPIANVENTSNIPIPDNDKDRIEALLDYSVLDTPPEDSFDALTHFAATTFGVSISLVSLVDQKRQWFKSAYGIAVDQTPREFALCTYAIMENEPLVVLDAAQDERFEHNPLVTGEPNIRFYAGAPLVTTDGFSIGTLCIIDTNPRDTFHQFEVDRLVGLARIVMSILEMRRRMLTGIDEHVADLEKTHEEYITTLTETANVILMTNLESEIELEKAVHERTLELQKANDARGEYLATINHEMRTPLNGILGMVEILQLKPSTAEQKELLDHLGVACRQLAGLVGDVLDFSKIDEKLTVINTGDFSSHSLVQDLTGLFSLSAKQKDIDLSLQLETGVSDWLRGDMPYLKQILTNLISNAIKFTEAGEVRLVISTTQSSERESEDQADLITFEVSDTGCGMEQAKLEHIFLPYYQIEDQRQPSVFKDTKVKIPGTGLGLAIAEGLAKAMGGSITVTSELGQGSCFSLTLPLPAVITPNKEPIHLKFEPKILDETQNCFINITILLVEDSPINQNVMTTFLQETGANICICDTGASAINHFKDHRPDLILMDYRLPDINGLAATESIRAYEKQLGRPECPIIIHTADNRAWLIDQAQLAGIDLILSKPFTQAQLINAISQGLEISNSSVYRPLRLNAVPKLIPLLDEFVDRNLASIELCRDRLTSSDVEALGNELHKCKGAAGMFGAGELHQTVLDMEEELVAAPYDMDLISTLLTQAERQLKGYRLRSQELE